MPLFQLEVAITLAVSAFCSFVVFYLSQEKEGNIQLPTNVEADSAEDFDRHEPDPFDVTTPEDLVDGYPIDGEAFWARVCALNCSDNCFC